MMAHRDIRHYQTRERHLVLNISTKFHKIVIKINVLRDPTQSNIVDFNEQRAIITPEGIVR